MKLPDDSIKTRILSQPDDMADIKRNGLIQQVNGLRQIAVSMIAFCDGIIAQLINEVHLEDSHEVAGSVATMGQHEDE